jgi:hypothetical protein
MGEFAVIERVSREHWELENKRTVAGVEVQAHPYLVFI